MAVDIQQSAAWTFTLSPPDLWTGATAKVYDPKGALLESPTPSASAVNTTVASATQRDQFVITDATGVTRGEIYRITDPSWGDAFAEVSAADGTTIKLTAPLPGIPDATATVRGISQTVAITSTATATRGIGLRVLLKYSGQELAQMFNVVRHPFNNPLSARIVREYVAQWWPSDPLLDDEEAMGSVADRGGQMLRGRLMTIGMYPHQYVDPEAFVEPARVCMRSILADENRIPGGADPIEYHRSLQFDLRDLIANIKHSLQPHDDNDDDDTTDTNLVGIRSGYLER